MAYANIFGVYAINLNVYNTNAPIAYGKTAF